MHHQRIPKINLISVKSFRQRVPPWTGDWSSTTGRTMTGVGIPSMIPGVFVSSQNLFAGVVISSVVVCSTWRVVGVFSEPSLRDPVVPTSVWT